MLTLKSMGAAFLRAPPFLLACPQKLPCLASSSIASRCGVMLYIYIYLVVAADIAVVEFYYTGIYSLLRLPSLLNLPIHTSITPRPKFNNINRSTDVSI